MIVWQLERGSDERVVLEFDRHLHFQIIIENEHGTVLSDHKIEIEFFPKKLPDLEKSAFSNQVLQKPARKSGWKFLWNQPENVNFRRSLKNLTFCPVSKILKISPPTVVP